MSVCPNCGATDNIGKFCESCGAALPVEQPVQPVYEQYQPAPAPQEVYQPAPAPQPVYQQPGPGYQPQPYASAPAQGYQPYAPTLTPKKPTNGACIAGFILGLVGIFTFGIPSFIGFIVSTIGVIVAAVKKQKGKVLGIIGMVLSLLMVVGVILFVANADKISAAFSDASGEGQSFEEWLFNDSYDGKIEMISETEWIDKNSGASLLFEANDNFKYYKDHNDLTNNYYTGTYEIYFGYEAMDILETKYGQYGVTSDSICDEIENNRGVSGVKEFMILVLHNDGCWVDGENTIDLKWDKVYMGYYNDNRMIMDLTCLDDNKNYYFVTWDDFV